MYPEQEISSLLSVICELIEEKDIDKDKFALQYAGTSSSLWKKQVKRFGLESVNINYGILSFEDSLNLQYNSNINLLLSWTTPNLKLIIPGKFYDYLQVGRPILLLINGDKDALWERKIGALNIGLVSYNRNKKDKALKDFILRLYQEWSIGDERLQKRNEIKFKYTWEYQVNNFLKQIKD